MDSIDLSIIKKTGILPEKELVGFRNKRKPSIFALNTDIQNSLSERIAGLSSDDINSLKTNNPRAFIKSFRKGEMIMRWDLLQNYRYLFNYETGYYARSEQLDKHGFQTGTEVFAANFPHLIDVGIMGHCTHGQSGLCIKSGVQCYQDGLNVAKSNMNLADFTRIAKECRNLTNQFALGGRGDPNEHENFGDILRICRENNIVPNYTTSGFGLTDKQISLSKQYCGAVAVSWYRNAYTLSAIERLIEAGVKTNIHYVLNTDTIKEAIFLLEADAFPKGINAVVFLTHKPVGLGQKEKCLHYGDPSLQKIFQLIRKGGKDYKLGVDGCLVVGLINSNLDFNMQYLDTCEASRFTCYIDADLKMHPCSFDMNDEYTIDLHDYTIAEAWNSEVFNKIRETLQTGCPSCKHNAHCMGGCFLHRDIVLCPDIQK